MTGPLAGVLWHRDPDSSITVEENADLVHASGAVIVNLVHHPLTGWRVHVHLYSTWGHAHDVEQYLLDHNMANEAYELVAEHVGEWLLAVKDDLTHRLPV